MRKIIITIGILTLIVLANNFCFAEGEVSVILFSRYAPNNWQIWAKNLDTGQELQLTDTPVDKRNPQWSAAAKNIFYRTANSEVYLFGIEKKSEKRILQRFGAIMDQRCSTDGKNVVFSRLRPDLLDDSDIWISDITGEGARYLTNEAGLQYCPVFSGDAKRIAFVSTNAEKGQTLYIMDTEGKNRKELTQGKFFDVLPQFSPDDKFIVFSSNRSGNFDIWRIELATQKIRRLTTFSGIDTSPVFSPDGDKIAFVSLKSGTLQIWSMDKEGKNLVMLTNNEEFPVQDPLWISIPESVWR